MSNCFDMRCPKCGDQDHIDVAATIWVRLVHNGTDADEAQIHDHEWDDDSAASCAACGYDGVAKDFSEGDRLDTSPSDPVFAPQSE